MKLTFRTLALLASCLFFSLAALWLFLPQVFLSSWGVDPTSSAELVGRRAGAVYVGISLMFYLARDAQPSLSRSALIKGVVFACLILVTLGILELVTGHAKIGILAAVLIEIALAIGLSIVHFQEGSERSARTLSDQSSRKFVELMR